LSFVLPTARVASLGLVALTVGLGALPTLLTVALGGANLFGPLVVAGVVAGAALGWGTDDPAAELLASTATGAPQRTAIRVAATAMVAGAGAALLGAVVAIGPGLPPGVGDRGPEAAAGAAASLAVGLVAARRGERAAGAAAVTAGVLSTAVVTGLSSKLDELPSYLPGPHHDRWWVVVVVALVVARRAGRDPGRR